MGLEKATLEALWTLVVWGTPAIGIPIAGVIAKSLRRQTDRMDQIQQHIDEVQDCAEQKLVKLHEDHMTSWDRRQQMHAEERERQQEQHEETLQRLSRLEAGFSHLCQSMTRVDQKMDQLLIVSRTK